MNTLARKGSTGLLLAALAMTAPAQAQKASPSPTTAKAVDAAGTASATGTASRPAQTAVAPANAPQLAPAAIGTMTATPATAPIEPAIRVLLIPQQETTVVSQIVGQVNRLAGDIGAPVERGAAIVTFDCGELSAKLKMSEAELTTVREQHEAKVRLQGLNAAGEMEVALAAAAVEKAKAQIDLSKAQLRQCVIAAPFSGRIVKLHVKQFQSVNIGQPLVDIVSSGPLKLKLNAPSKWLGWLRPGAKFEVRIDETGKTYPAVVSAVNGRVDAASQSIEIEGRVGGTYGDLLAGMSGNARFPQAH